MRYPASEKLEIIRLVERSHLPVKRTLNKLGIARATFYRWVDLYRLSMPLKITDPHQGMCGTEYRIRSGARSLIWRSTFLS